MWTWEYGGPEDHLGGRLYNNVVLKNRSHILLKRAIYWNGFKKCCSFTSKLCIFIKTVDVVYIQIKSPIIVRHCLSIAVIFRQNYCCVNGPLDLIVFFLSLFASLIYSKLGHLNIETQSTNGGDDKFNTILQQHENRIAVHFSIFHFFRHVPSASKQVDSAIGFLKSGAAE